MIKTNKEKVGAKVEDKSGVRSSYAEAADVLEVQNQFLECPIPLSSCFLTHILTCLLLYVHLKRIECTFLHSLTVQGLDRSYIINFRYLRLETPPIAAGGGGQVYRAQMHGLNSTEICSRSCITHIPLLWFDFKRLSEKQ